jgi:hypothetical protein
MEEGQVTLQDWLNLLMSRKSTLESKVIYYMGGTLSLLALSITLNYLIYFETGNLFPIGLSEENLLSIPLKIFMIIFFYSFLLEFFRLDAFNNLINKIMTENKTELEYIKEKYLLIEQLCDSYNLYPHYENYKLIHGI